MYPGVVEAWAEEDPQFGCSLRRVPMQSLSSNAFPLQKDSELRGFVNYQLNMMKETGIDGIEKDIQ